MEQMQFRGQKKDEVVLAVFHKSVWAYLKSYLLALVLFMVPLLVLKYLPILLPFYFAFPISLIGAGIILLRAWYLWVNNLFIITNHRVIALSQKAIFQQELKEAYLKDICQVSAQVKGIIPSLGRFGHVLVNTEAELWLYDVEDPYDVKEAIYDAIQESKAGKAGEQEAKFWAKEQG